MTSDETPQKVVTIVPGTLKDIAEAVVHAAEAGTLKQVFQQVASVAQPSASLSADKLKMKDKGRSQTRPYENIFPYAGRSQTCPYGRNLMLSTREILVGVLSEHGTMKYFEVIGLAPEEIRQIAHPPIGRGLLGFILEAREILRLDHMSDHPQSER